MIIGGSGLVFAIALVFLLEHHEREQLESHVSESVQREAQALSNTLSLAMKERLLQLRLRRVGIAEARVPEPRGV